MSGVDRFRGTSRGRDVAAMAICVVLLAAGCASGGQQGTPASPATPVSTVAAGMTAPASQAPPAVGPTASPPLATPLIGTVAADIPVDNPRDVHAAFGSIWVANGPSATVTRFDPATNAIIATIAVPDPASVIADGAGALWLTSYAGNSLTRIDPLTNKATKTISLASAGSGAIGVAYAAGFIWVADHDGSPTTSVAKVNPTTMKVVRVIPVGRSDQSGPVWLVAAAGSVWTDVPDMGAVVRIDAATDKIVATIPVQAACAMMTATNDVVWVAGGGGDGCVGVIIKIDPKTNSVVKTISLAGDTAALALGSGSLWYGSAPGVLGKVDSVDGTVAGEMALPGTPFGEALAFGYVWITDRDGGRLFKVRPS